MNQKCQNHAGRDQKDVSKCISFSIIRLTNSYISSHQVDNPECSHQVDDFHDRVVQRNEGKEEVQVATDKDQGIQLLCFQRYSYTTRDRVRESFDMYETTQ